MNGIVSFRNSGIVVFNKPITVYMPIPTGGVNKPTTTTMHIIIPKNTGSIPKFLTNGTKIGASKITITVPSINIPKISRNIIKINKTKKKDKKKKKNYHKKKKKKKKY